MTIPKFARIVVEEKGLFLVVKSLYKSQIVWNFPGGKCFENESFEDAAKREVREESGLIIRKPQYLFSQNYLIDGMRWEGTFFYTNQFRGKLVNKEPKKVLEIQFLPPEKIIDLPCICNLLIQPLRVVDAVFYI